MSHTPGMFTVLACIWLVLAAASVAWAQAADLMTGKVRTGRSIMLDVVVPGGPGDVLALWTTTDGVRRFFAPEARIEPQAGGEYTIIFLPGLDPEGASHGTRGARVIAYEPGRRFAFEWITFIADDGPNRPGAPPASSALRAERPLPTWVELAVSADPTSAGQTRLRLEHHGFRHGPIWDEALTYFQRAWRSVLANFETFCRTGRSPSFGGEVSRRP